MRARLLVFILLLAAPLCAAEAKPRVWESNFGEAILANCDIVVLGVAAAQRLQINGATSVEITVQEVLYGEEKATTISVLLSDTGVLKREAAVEGLFALKRIAGKGYSLVGKPEEAASGDQERDMKLSVAQAFIALEAEEAGAKRTQAYLDLLARHLLQGTYTAQNAALELKLWVQRRPELVTREIFDRFVKLHSEMGVAKSKIRADLFWALTLMVERKIKNDEFRQARRGKTTADKGKAIDALVALRENYTAAFGEADARLCDALAKDDSYSDAQVSSLTKLADAIRAELRRLEEERKRAGRPTTETRDVPAAEGTLPQPKILPAPPPRPEPDK
ncbi:MAG: hypothetical protein IT462_17095 [Planctomycetes bacterium]|nr:hypothetical protein [Planctomycetota bacterium]